MKVAALQWDVRRSDVSGNLAVAQRGLERAAELGIELALLPEMWATSFPAHGDDVAGLARAARDAASRLADASARLGVDFGGSGYFLDPSNANRVRPSNRFELYGGGRLLLGYDKLHLFGPTAENAVFDAGSLPPATVVWRGIRVSAVICYDLRFTELTRAPFYAAAELLLVPAQWPSERATQWRALVHGLAASGQCFVLACNRRGRESLGGGGTALEFPGNSLLVDPAGRTLAEGHGEEGLIASDIDPALARRVQRETPVRRDRRTDVYGDWTAAGT